MLAEAEELTGWLRQDVLARDHNRGVRSDPVGPPECGIQKTLSDPLAAGIFWVMSRAADFFGVAR